MLPGACLQPCLEYFECVHVSVAKRRVCPADAVLCMKHACGSVSICHPAVLALALLQEAMSALLVQNALNSCPMEPSGWAGRSELLLLTPHSNACDAPDDGPQLRNSNCAPFVKRT